MLLISILKGQFERIYPPYDKEKLQYYDKLLDGAMKLFLSGIILKV